MRKLLLACALLGVFPRAEAEADQPAAQAQLKLLSIEELMAIDVTSAARRPEPLRTTAAAISVLTGDDIRRAGVTTIADAIRLAEGVHVARFNNGTWGISPRGFTTNTANKLLVMVDGRTVYSPLFAGVFWNMVDYALEDIERIEVIRGPGAALWGANAVNGVINIITRPAADTQGTYVSIGGGNEDPLLATARYGASTGGAAWRVYGKFAGRAAQRLASGAAAGDDRRRGQVGFRIDGGADTATRWRLSGDALHSREGLPDRPDGEFTDLNVLGAVDIALAPGSRLAVQSYYRREYRRVPRQLTHHIDIADVDAQHAWTVHPRHNLVWGGGVRINRDVTHRSAVLAFDPAQRTYAVTSVFVQDEFALLPDRLFVTAGAKYEHNAFSGGAFQPNLRARAMLPRAQMVWGAIARAVRRPTRFEDDLLAFGPTGAVLVAGSDDVVAESLRASEVGYRARLSAVLTAEATVFHHDYDDLRSQDLTGGLPPIVVGNSLEGRSVGIETAATVQPVPWWRTRIGYTWLETEVRRAPGSRDVGGGATEANDPHHLFGLRTSFDLPGGIELDAMLRTVGDVPTVQVPAYTELDLRAAWQATPRAELWVAGQDLLHDRHPELGPDTPARLEFERAFRAGLTIRVGP